MPLGSQQPLYVPAVLRPDVCQLRANDPDISWEQYEIGLQKNLRFVKVFLLQKKI